MQSFRTLTFFPCLDIVLMENSYSVTKHIEVGAYLRWIEIGAL